MIQSGLFIWTFAFYTQTFKGVKITRWFPEDMCLTQEWTHPSTPSGIMMFASSLRVEQSSQGNW